MTTQNENVPALRFPDFNDEWQEKRISDVAKIMYGKDQKQIADKDGKYPILGTGGVMGRTNSFLYDKPSVLIGRKGTIDQPRYMETPFWTVDTLFYTEVLENTFPKWLYYEFQTINWYLHNEASGVPSLSGSTIYKIKLNAPTLAEQQKIAAFLTAVDEKIQQLAKKKDVLEQYKKGVMQKIFNQEIRFKDDNGNDFADWEEKALGEIAKFRRGSFPQPYGLEKWYDDENGSPFVQVFDVNDNWKLKEDTKRKISIEAQKFSVFAEKGTVVLTIQGSIGRIAITQYDTFVDRTLLIFESFKVTIDKYFFMYSVFLLFQIEKEKAPGGTIKTITKEVLSEFTIVLPCIEEQIKIAKFFFSIDDKINSVNQQLEKTQTYKKGLLQQMFI